MVAYTDSAESGISLKNDNIRPTKSHSSKSTTKISIPENDCYQTNCKRFEKQISRISRAIHHVHSTKNNTFSSSLFSVKTVGLILLFCDIVYLNSYLSRTESALQLTLKKIENLETELYYSKLTTKILRSDFNSAKNANNKVTQDIIATLSNLMRHTESFIDHSKFDDKGVLDHLFVRQNDNTMRNFIQKSVDELNNVNNELLIFSNENPKLPLESEEIASNPNTPEFHAYVGLENNGAINNNDKINELVDKSEENVNLDEHEISFPNETVWSISATDDDFATRTRREAIPERRGPLALILRGIHPEVIIQDGGSLIAPWVADRNGPGEYPFKDFNFREGNGKIEISGKGLYLIYAQVFYLSANHLNGFSINMQKSNAEADFEIAKCSVDIASKRTSEVSCYTSVVRQLLPGDKVYLIQRERNSRILHGEGYTYFGLIALNSPPKC